MDITSPTLLKLKGILFFFLGLLCAGLLLMFVQPLVSWKVVALLLLCVWAFCRAYYFCFYVLHHYVDGRYRYAGMWDLFLCATGLKKKPKADLKGPESSRAKQP